MNLKYLKNTSELLKDAEIRDYGVGGVEVWDQTSLKAAIEAAVETSSPIQIIICAPMVKSIGISVFSQMAFQYIEEASIPTAVHLDECRELDTIMKCIKAGFSSVMFDGAELDFDTNMRITKKVVEVAHTFDVSVEASLGRMPFSKKGTTELIEDDNLSKYLTNVDEAVEFTSKTGIDILAPSIGNIHALYENFMPEPDWELGKRIHESTKLMLSWHGATGATDKQTRKAISIGFRKINCGTRFMEIYRKTMKLAAEKYEGYPSAFKILNECKSAMKEEVKRLIIEVYHSNNKA